MLCACWVTDLPRPSFLDRLMTSRPMSSTDCLSWACTATKPSATTSPKTRDNSIRSVVSGSLVLRTSSFQFGDAQLVQNGERSRWAPARRLRPPRNRGISGASVFSAAGGGAEEEPGRRSEAARGVCCGNSWKAWGAWDNCCRVRSKKRRNIRPRNHFGSAGIVIHPPRNTRNHARLDRQPLKESCTRAFSVQTFGAVSRVWRITK